MTPTRKKRQVPVDFDQVIADLALRMVLHCVRNTVIEDYHSQGKLTDPEMKAFNKEVVNKAYTFLQIVLNPDYEEQKEVLFSSPYLFYKPSHWDAPEPDRDFMAVLDAIAQEKKPRR